MPKEIERRFLVDEEKFINGGYKLDKFSTIKQAYLSRNPVVRVRLSYQHENGAIKLNCFLTIKGKKQNYTSSEYEYEIPEKDGLEMYDLSDFKVQKNRFEIDFADKKWYIDYFSDKNSGLIIAEIELEDEAEEFAIPPFVSKEITKESKYSNSNLSAKPYSDWKEKAGLA